MTFQKIILLFVGWNLQAWAMGDVLSIIRVAASLPHSA